MATSIQHPTLPTLATPFTVNTPQIPAEAGNRITRMVAASISDTGDREAATLVARRAYRMGSEACHRAMIAQPEQAPVTLAEIEREAIVRAYSLTQGDVIATAKLLDVGKTTIYRRLREYGIHTPTPTHCHNCGASLRVTVAEECHVSA